MNEDASSAIDADLRDVLQRRAPDIEWLMVHTDIDIEAARWVRVRAERDGRIVQFVIILPKSENTDSNMIAARSINEALHLLGK